MTELINELAIKAKIQMVSEPRLQEFADLIVDECLQLLKSYNTKCAITTYDQMMVECTRMRLIEGLREHFKK